MHRFGKPAKVCDPKWLSQDLSPCNHYHSLPCVTAIVLRNLHDDVEKGRRTVWQRVSSMVTSDIFFIYNQR